MQCRSIHICNHSRLSSTFTPNKQLLRVCAANPLVRRLSSTLGRKPIRNNRLDVCLAPGCKSTKNVSRVAGQSTAETHSGHLRSIRNAPSSRHGLQKCMWWQGSSRHERVRSCVAACNQEVSRTQQELKHDEPGRCSRGLPRRPSCFPPRLAPMTHPPPQRRPQRQRRRQPRPRPLPTQTCGHQRRLPRLHQRQRLQHGQRPREACLHGHRACVSITSSRRKSDGSNTCFLSRAPPVWSRGAATAGALAALAGRALVLAVVLSHVPALELALSMANQQRVDQRSAGYSGPERTGLPPPSANLGNCWRNAMYLRC